MSDSLDDKALAELEALEKAATPGPWRAMDFQRDYGPNETTVAGSRPGSLSIWPDGVAHYRIAETEEGDNPLPDAAFIAAARNAFPGLLAEVRRSREAIAAAVEAERKADEAIARYAYAQGRESRDVEVDMREAETRSCVETCDAIRAQPASETTSQKGDHDGRERLAEGPGADSASVTGAAHLWRHKKRGTTYRVLGEAQIQTEEPLCDMSDVVVYRSEKDGSLWVRRKSEFYDGRFEKGGGNG